MKKQKILYLITKANWGGAQKYVFDLASEMAGRNDYEIVVAFGKPFGELSEKLKTLNLQSDKKQGIRIIQIDNLERDINFFGEFKVAKNLWKILRKEKPDVIHLNSPKIGGLGALLGRLCGVDKIIYTAHGWAFNEQRPYWQKILIKFFSWLTIILNHKTIAVAKKEYEQVINWPFVTNKKLKLIYNGIKPIYFLNRDEAQGILAKTLLQNKRVCPNISDKKCFREAKISQKLNDNLVLGTIAELHKNKGLKYAIRGFAKIKEKYKNIKFVIVGEGEERELLEKEISERSLSDDIFLVGHIADASSCLKAFDIFVLPSIKEGFPFVLLEAGLAKLPVVASDVGGISELILNGENGILVSARGVDEIEMALETLIADEGLRVGYGEALYEKIKEEFSFEGMVERVGGLY